MYDMDDNGTISQYVLYMRVQYTRIAFSRLNFKFDCKCDELRI